MVIDDYVKNTFWSTNDLGAREASPVCLSRSEWVREARPLPLGHRLPLFAFAVWIALIRPRTFFDVANCNGGGDRSFVGSFSGDFCFAVFATVCGEQVLSLRCPLSD